MKNNGSMNRLFRVIWNAATGAWQAVTEVAKGQGKSTSSKRLSPALVAGAFVLMSAAAYADALPTGGTVVGGSATISQSGSNMTINQTTAKMAADWQSFSIGTGSTVTFNQPSASSVALNRVLGSDVSVIQGALNANGQVFLINPNGVLFTPTAQVNVGGLIASTLSLSTADFMAGSYKFEGSSSNAIINQGRITAAGSGDAGGKGGTIALIAAKITNTGTLTANQGNVLLGAGSKVTLDLGGPVKLQVEQGAIDALIEQGGAIKADGGLVYLSAQAANLLVTTVINHTGITEAQTLATGEKGEIYLMGGMAKDRIVVGGKLDASAPNGGNGGFIETSAAHVDIAKNISVTTAASQGTTGEWLIDPYDVLIASSGGNITGATIATALNSTNVTIDTTVTTPTGTTYASPVTGGGADVGDITVNDAIAKTGSSATTLTLKAHNNININQAITSSTGRLNVVLTADQDNSNGGDVNFGASGRVVTNNGNFYVGSVSGTYDTVTASGQSFIMATGSYINAGRGNLDISVKGNVQLPNNSAQTVTYALSSAYNDGIADYYRYFNSGNQQYYFNAPYQYLNVSTTGVSGSITTTNTSAAVADIVTSVDTRLSAASIGTSGSAIRLSGYADPYGLVTNPTYNTKNFANTAKTLYLTNTTGSTYVNEIGVQNYSAINLTVGSQTTATQQVNIMGDTGGVGHITLNNDGAGVLALATGNISTGGVPGVYGTYLTGSDPSVFPTSVSISAPTMTFADDSVNTGGYVSYFYQGVGSYYKQNWGMSSNYSASFSATATTMTSSQLLGAADINAVTVNLAGTSIGTLAAPVEVGSGQFLNIDNLGGSTFAKVVDNTFSNITLANRKTVGEHHVLWRDGDHIDYSTNGSGVLIPTITGGQSDGLTFTSTQGIDTHLANRSVSLNAYSGYLELNTNSVNLGSGTFGANIGQSNTDRNQGKAIYATNGKDTSAEITAGDVNFNIYSSTLGSIADIEIAKGGTSTTNTLTVNTYQGNVDLTELTTNHFKSLNATLNGSSAAQNVAIALAGADDVSFSDSGSLVTIDGTKVNLSANNRNWNLQAPSRQIQVDGVSLSTGNYTLNAGNTLKLNGNILTNGGNIYLTGSGSGIVLMKTARIDSNADDLANSASTGNAGSIQLSGNLSGSASGYALTVDTASSTTNGGNLFIYNSTGNAGGAYLSGLTMTAKGSTNNNDGTTYLYGNYLLNGNFSSTGNSYLYNSYMTIDTEQGNTANGGNISFSGSNLVSAYGGSQHTFNTATTASGMSGGNIDLFGTVTHSTLSNAKLTITSTGGAGGGAGSINLPAISAAINGYDNSQTINGGIITLNGNITTERSNVTINGDVRLATDVTIDTWQSAAANQTRTGTAGTVTIMGAGISATAANKSLTINTSTDTGTGNFNTPTNTQDWTHNGGAVTLSNAGNAGGNYLSSLTVNTSKNGSSNSGVNGAIVLNGATTTANQTYIGSTIMLNAALATTTGTVSMTATGAVSTTATGSISAANLLLQGTAGSNSFSLASNPNSVGTLAATGIAGLSFINSGALAIGAVSATNGISASGAINIATLSGDLTLSQNIGTTNTSANAIVLNAGKNAAAGTATGGNILLSGAPTITVGTGGLAKLMSGSVSGSTGLTALVGSGSGNFRYNSDETDANYTTALATAGTVALYREQPKFTVTPSAATSVYGATPSVAGVTGNVTTAYVNGDTTSAAIGTASFTTDALSTSQIGSYNITYTGGLSNGLGYGYQDASASVGEYIMTGRAIASNVSVPKQAAIQAAQSSTTAPAVGITQPIGGFINALAPAVLTNSTNVKLFGGLAFMDVPAESAGSSANTGSTGSSSGSPQGSTSNDGAGRDISGFMRVFVVGGGISLEGR
jgi:filamentous hemagglutinin family protein